MNMGDDNSDKAASLVLITNRGAKPKRKRQYSDEDKATALATLDANDGNVKRTATQLGIPHKTLDDWAKGRNQHPAVAELRTHKKGSLAEKFENLAHLIVDACPRKSVQATLSQCAVSSGIATDKAIRLREEEPDINPAVELARILGISVKQLPPTLRLEPGEEIPEGFGFILDTKRDPDGAYEVENPSPSADPDATEEPSHALVGRGRVIGELRRVCDPYSTRKAIILPAPNGGLCGRLGYRRC
jgi:transposase-like protein